MATDSTMIVLAWKMNRFHLASPVQHYCKMNISTICYAMLMLLLNAYSSFVVYNLFYQFPFLLTATSLETFLPCIESSIRMRPDWELGSMKRWLKLRLQKRLIEIHGFYKRLFRTELFLDHQSNSPFVSRLNTPNASRRGSFNDEFNNNRNKGSLPDSISGIQINTGDLQLSSNAGVTDAFKEIGSQIWRRKTVEKYFPITQWLPKYNLTKFISDLIAAITVAITMLPQGMAYASIAGLPMQYGLYSCFAGCFVHIFFGSAPQMVIGPTAILAILTQSYTLDLPEGSFVMITFLTGVMTLLLGVFKLGFIVNFISKPVSTAFTTAAALTICSTQFKEVLGIVTTGQGFLEAVKSTVGHIGETRLPDCLLSIGSIALLIFLRQLTTIFSRFKDNAIIKFISIARNSLIVIITTGIVTAIGPSQPFTVIKDITDGLPPFSPPPFSITNTTTNVTHTFAEDILGKTSSAIIVMPMLALMEHISIAKALAGEKMVDASQEMISTGLSNLVGSFFSGIPVTGSFSLTTVNAASGCATPMSGLITGTLVLLAIRFMTPYFYYIPKASLASVIICAVVFMIDYEIIRKMWYSKKMELIPWALTTLVGLFIGLQYGMMVGFLISVTYLMYYAARPGVKVKRGYTSSNNQFILIQLDRSMTFPSVEYIRYVITKASRTVGHNNKLPLVIDCSHIQYADFTAAQSLCDLITMFKKRDQVILLWKAKDSIVGIIEGVDSECHVVMTDFELENILDKRVSQLPEIFIEISGDGKSVNNVPINNTTVADKDNNHDKDNNNESRSID